MAFVEIGNASDPRLDVYRDLNHVNLQRYSGRFVAELSKVSEPPQECTSQTKCNRKAANP